VKDLIISGKEDIRASGYTFTGRVCRTEDDKEWLKRRFAMFHKIDTVGKLFCEGFVRLLATRTRLKRLAPLALETR
jgi:hypothetical protein